MRYVSLSSERATTIVSEIKKAKMISESEALKIFPESELTDSDEVIFQSDELDKELIHIKNRAEKLHEIWNKNYINDVEAGEAWMSKEIFMLINPMESAIKRDFGFWRYLALFPFRWYWLSRTRPGTVNKISDTLPPVSYGGQEHRVDENGFIRIKSSDMRNQLLLRTFFWGQIAYDESATDPFFRATLFGETTKKHKLNGSQIDIWHSHLIRNQIGQLGRMPHAFLDSMCSPVFVTEIGPTRQLELRIARMKHSINFDILSLDECRKIVDAQKPLAISDSVRIAESKKGV